MRYIKGIYAAIRLQTLGGKIKGEHEVLEVSEDTVTLARSDDTSVPGIQSLFWDSREGHSIVEPHSRDTRTVTYRVLKNFRSAPKQGDKIWLSGWLGEAPEDFGITPEYVDVSNGTKALISRRNSSKWVIHVHGRNATMAETFRNFKVFDDLGYNQLFMAHESDGKPFGLGRKRSRLGSSEWKQVEAVVAKAKEFGASEVVLVGWSLGAMFVGEFLRNSELNNMITGVVLDSPLVDYPSTLELQAQLAGMDPSFGTYVSKLLTKSLILKAIGYGVKELPTLIRNIDVKVLVMYSETDGYVSMKKMGEFKAFNPKGTFVEFDNGKHCRLYNQNPEFYSDRVRRFISEL